MTTTTARPVNPVGRTTLPEALEAIADGAAANDRNGAFPEASMRRFVTAAHWPGGPVPARSVRPASASWG